MILDLFFSENLMPVENDRLQTLIYQSNKGYSVSQVKLATHYWVIERNTPMAYKYATMAAENGNPDGMWVLSSVHFFSEEYEDEEKGKKWLLKAAECGQDSAAYFAGSLYCEGLFGFEENRELGINYLRMAAFKGNFSAMSTLIDVYSKCFFEIPESERKGIQHRKSQDYIDLISYWAKEAIEIADDEEKKEEIKATIRKLKEAVE